MMGAIFVQLTIVYLGLSAFGVFVGFKIDSELQGISRGKYIATTVVYSFLLCSFGFFVSCFFMAGEEVHTIVFGAAVYFSLLVSFLALAFSIRSEDRMLVKLRNALVLAPLVLPLTIYALYDVFTTYFGVDMSNSY